MSSPPPSGNINYGQFGQFFDYLVVIDFEATCFKESPSDFVPEIIQFPAILIETKRMKIIDEFCVYCKPVRKPNLSGFCTQLTGITQEMVDEAPYFPMALEMFNQWLWSHQLGTIHSFAIVTDGPYDMGHFLYTQCQVSNLPFPSYAARWINIRKSFTSHYEVRWLKLQATLDLIGEPFQGRPHDGLDDSRNIGNIVIRLLRDSHIFTQNEKIVLGKEDQDFNLSLQKSIFGIEKYMRNRLPSVAPLFKQEFLYCYNLETMLRNNPKLSNNPYYFQNHNQFYPQHSDLDKENFQFNSQHYNKYGFSSRPNSNQYFSSSSSTSSNESINEVSQSPTNFLKEKRPLPSLPPVINNKKKQPELVTYAKIVASKLK